MKSVNVHEAKTKLSALLAEVERTGEVFLICRNGAPVAELSPHRHRDRLRPHPVMSRIRIRYDPTQPLGESDWPEAE
ncbi:MAG: type II toxin-antitoxin system Phd/YefM family antitoxin [Deltaproteobacteria bacterium]|nr:type II toxin-antitoxin system Phd/YefM family antitoxin [Deltaproteobacteria bacterium]